MKSETREGNEGRAEEMERLGWSGREGEMGLYQATDGSDSRDDYLHKLRKVKRGRCEK